MRADGIVADATVKRSTGDGELDQIAVDAAKRWPFSPESLTGMAKNSLARVSMALDVPLQAGPGCPLSAASAANPYVMLRIVGDGLRGDGPVDAKHAIYLTVLTDGCGWSALTAQWYYDGPRLKPQLVNKTSNDILSQGLATTVFHLKNPDLWPVGSYHVDIQVNGLTVKTRHFVISRSGLSTED
ncbi:hypothetical protein GCM10007898_38240 [Dyella flagellata]|uniref:TonB C-terminal domain-containing protein n=1 Tax=Dyella flagellata TaxID=1867833 RepID=A0ABQ5XGD8_9GAMM|nr:hypothetical protein GCM10007898_38240 [Dyella flagellata]